MAATTDATSNQVTLNLSKTLQTIVMVTTLAVPEVGNWSTPTHAMAAAVPTCHQCRVFQRISTKANCHTGNVPAIAAETSVPTIVLNIHYYLNRVKAQIHCGAMSIFGSLSLHNRL